jgi:tryptophanase
MPTRRGPPLLPARRSPMKMVYEPSDLRFFQARFEPID